MRPYKGSLKANFFFKHQCVLINQNIFMKTNRINIFLPKSLKKVLVEMFKFLLFFGVFSSPKTCYLDLNQVNFLCYTDFKMRLCENYLG